MGKETKGEMSFLEHLEELRWHIIRSVLAVLFFAILAYVFSRYIFDYVLIAPQYPDFPTNYLLCRLGLFFHSPSLCINTKPLSLINTALFGQFSTDMGVSAIAGFILASPFVFWEFWKFVAPALHENERNNARGAVFAISGLFLIGVMFGYFVIVPFTIHFLGTYSISNKVENLININSYFSSQPHRRLQPRRRPDGDVLHEARGLHLRRAEPLLRHAGAALARRRRGRRSPVDHGRRCPRRPGQRGDQPGRTDVRDPGPAGRARGRRRIAGRSQPVPLRHADGPRRRRCAVVPVRRRHRI